jgi:hypothetical protein
MSKPTLGHIGACALSGAGLALAVEACFDLDGHVWAQGLSHAGLALWLVLAPFTNVRVLWATRRRSLGANMADRSMRLLPARLAPLSALATCLLLASIVVDIAQQLGF